MPFNFPTVRPALLPYTVNRPFEKKGRNRSPQSSDEVIRQARERRQQQIAECARRAVKKILAKMKSGRPSEATLAELIAGEFEELTH
jgi:hypothetical protein